MWLTINQNVLGNKIHSILTRILNLHEDLTLLGPGGAAILIAPLTC